MEAGESRSHFADRTNRFVVESQVGLITFYSPVRNKKQFETFVSKTGSNID